MSRKFLSVLMSVLLMSFMMIVACGDDDDGGNGGGGGADGGFDIQSGPDLSETEFNNTVNSAFSDANVGLSGLGSNEDAQNALVGLSFGQSAIFTVTGLLGDADVFGGLSQLSKSAIDTTYELDLLNGVIMSIVIDEVTAGHSLLMVVDGTCTENPSISFTNEEVASGFLSSNFRNGDFTYNVGELFDATLCGEFTEGDFDGTWIAEWAIATDGTVFLFVDLDFMIEVQNQGTTSNFDYDYTAEFVINPDGSGSAVGSITYSIDGTVVGSGNFDITWS